MTKSCLNCKHVHFWWQPATYWEPEDSGYECNYPRTEEMVSSDPGDPPSDLPSEYEPEFYAKDCPAYEFFNHEGEQQLADEAANEMYERSCREFGVVE